MNKSTQPIPQRINPRIFTSTTAGRSHYFSRRGQVSLRDQAREVLSFRNHRHFGRTVIDAIGRRNRDRGQIAQPRLSTVNTAYSDWPRWLQVAVVGPNALLAAYAFWFWWPKSKREWNRFGFLMAYLVVFFLVMRFVFQFR